MSVNGGYYANEDFLSAARANRKSVTQINGVDVASLPATYGGQLIVVQANGGGLSVDTAYIRDSTNATWKGMGSGKHLHDSDTEAAGGLLSDIVMANMAQLFFLDFLNPAVGQFDASSASGGSASNDTPNGRIDINTGGSTGGYANLGKSGVTLDFANNSKLYFKGFATANTFISIRIGVGIEHVNNAIDTNRKYGLEACDSAGTARNYDTISADGTTRSAAASTENVSQSSARFYRVEHTAGQDVKFYANNVLKVTKTTNIPATSRSSGVNNIGIGCKTNNTTADHLYVYGVRLTGRISDAVWS